MSRTSRFTVSQSTYNLFDGAPPLHSVHRFSHSRRRHSAHTAEARRAIPFKQSAPRHHGAACGDGVHGAAIAAAAAGTINADVSTASNSGSLAQMSVALHRKASAHCTTLRRDPLLLLRTCITEKTYFWLAIIFFLHLVYRSNEDTQNVSVVKSQ